MSSQLSFDSEDNTMPSAVGTVLATAEFLEAILHKLPTKDLLFVQAISKSWKDMIANSPKLQRALFRKPIDIEPLTWKTDGKKRALLSFCAF